MAATQRTKPASRPKKAVTRSLVVTADEERGVSEQIFGFFKEQLASGQLKPGDKLLPERELAGRLGVSRPMLREVMRAMALLGVIEIRAGQAAIITVPTAEVLGDFFSMLLSMQPTIYEQVMEARIAIECQAVRLACLKANPSDIQRLESVIERIQLTASDEIAGAEADFDFHTQLVAASHNEVLRLLHVEIAALVRRGHYERRRAASGDTDLLSSLGEAHRQLVDAILARDPDAAESVVRDHFVLAETFRAQKRLWGPRRPAKSLARPA
jgi:DNA-binding FadR family transcriptional regulator